MQRQISRHGRLTTLGTSDSRHAYFTDFSCTFPGQQFCKCNSAGRLWGGPRAAGAAGTVLGERLPAKEHESRFPSRLVGLVLLCFPSSNEESENI